MTPDRLASDRIVDDDPKTWRTLALSVVAVSLKYIIGFLLSGGDTPDYSAPNQDWTNWAGDNESNNQVAVILSLLAGVAFLLFAATIHSVLRAADGTAPLARAFFAGAITGIIGIVTALVMIGAATFHGTDSNPVVSIAVIDAAAGPFLLASMGFAAMLGAAAILTFRTEVFPRWTSIVALIGALTFLVTFLAVTDADNDDSVFGLGYPIGFLSLAIWSIAASFATFRKAANTTGTSTADSKRLTI